jgi:hypothetical protein
LREELRSEASEKEKWELRLKVANLERDNALLRLEMLEFRVKQANSASSGDLGDEMKKWFGHKDKTETLKAE